MRRSSMYVRQSARGCHETDLAGLWYWQRKSKRSSGTGTLLSFGSIVQNGKFSAAAWLLVSTLKKVDFLQRTASGKPLVMSHNTHTLQISTLYGTRTYPTLGNPTIPIFREVPNRPINGGCFGASTFLGGICVNYKSVNSYTVNVIFHKEASLLHQHCNPRKSSD